jgi:hypothetical protein
VVASVKVWRRRTISAASISQLLESGASLAPRRNGHHANFFFGPISANYRLVLALYER